ncbi:MAG: hypothetical protein JWO12_140 [Frankiales bacterium]|nr:hypothetical protein [Frankiales bacterium]
MRRLLLLLLLLGLCLPGAPTTTRPALVPAAAATPDWQPTYPIHITNFYPVATDSAYRVHPAKANYRDVDVIAKQVADMQYAGQNAATYAWFGRGSFQDSVFGNALRAADGTSFRWALFYELEGASGPNHGNPTVAQIKTDLDWIYSRYSADKNYLRIGGKPVLWVYHQAGDTCEVEQRWAQADAAHRFYVVQHWLPGYTGCRPGPQSWYVYAPAAGRTTIGSSVVAVSPGYYAERDAQPKLSRSVSRFTADLKAMKAAKVQWKETTTWNEWSEGTGVENAAEWRSSSGHGAYVDAMHSVLGSAPNTPLAPTGVTSSTSGQNVTISWNASAGATSYDVYRGGCKLATVTSPTYTDSTLTDTSASYTVKATNARGTGLSGATTVGIAGTPVPAPTSSGDGLVALPAQKILSTSEGIGLDCHGRLHGQFDVNLPASVPADATGVVLGLTTYSSFGGGNVQAYPTGGTLPPVYLMRYVPNSATSTSTVVPIGRGRQIQIRSNGAATSLEINLLGYTHPGPGGLTTKPSTHFVNATGVSGTVTYALPSFVPADATAVQLKVRTYGGTAQGNLVAWAHGSAQPSGNSMSFGAKGLVADSVLVPVTDHSISVNVTTPTSLQLGIDGWVTAASPERLTVDTASRLLFSTAPTGSTSVTLPVADAGHVVLLSVTVANGASTSLASVYGSGQPTPDLATLAFSPAQPMSTLVWVTVPANRVVNIQMRASGLLFVDRIAGT